MKGAIHQTYGLFSMFWLNVSLASSQFFNPDWITFSTNKERACEGLNTHNFEDKISDALKSQMFERHISNSIAQKRVIKTKIEQYFEDKF